MSDLQRVTGEAGIEPATETVVPLGRACTFVVNPNHSPEPAHIRDT